MPRALQKTNEKKKKKQFKVSFHRWTHFSLHLPILIYSLIYQRTENIVWYLAEQWVDNCHMYTSHTPDNIHSSCDFEEPQGLHSAALLRCSSYFVQVPESVVQTTVSGNGNCLSSLAFFVLSSLAFFVLSSLVLFPPPTWQRDTWRKLYSTVFLPFQKSYAEGVLWRTWLDFQNLWIMFLTFSGFFSAIAKIITHLCGLLPYLIFIRRSKKLRSNL